MPLATPPRIDFGLSTSGGDCAGAAFGGVADIRSTGGNGFCVGTDDVGTMDVGAVSSERRSTGAGRALSARIVGAPRGGGVNAPTGPGSTLCVRAGAASPNSASASFDFMLSTVGSGARTSAGGWFDVSTPPRKDSKSSFGGTAALVGAGARRGSGRPEGSAFEA